VAPVAVDSILEILVVVVVLAVEDSILLAEVVRLPYIYLYQQLEFVGFVRLHLGVVLKFVHKDFVRLDQINYQVPSFLSTLDPDHIPL